MCRRSDTQEAWIDRSRVLVVEDDPIVLLSAAETLRAAGFTVTEAESADEAFAILQAISGGVDVVFTDVETPGELDGLGLARLVVETWPAVPVIVTSGRLRLQASDLPGAARFVGKPYDLDHVTALIFGLAAA